MHAVLLYIHGPLEVCFIYSGQHVSGPSFSVALMFPCLPFSPVSPLLFVAHVGVFAGSAGPERAAAYTD